MAGCNWDEDQLRAIDRFGDVKILKVVGCPGSGKTRVLVQCVRRIFRRSADPLTLAFNNGPETAAVITYNKSIKIHISGLIAQLKLGSARQDDAEQAVYQPEILVENTHHFFYRLMEDYPEFLPLPSQRLAAIEQKKKGRLINLVLESGDQRLTVARLLHSGNYRSLGTCTPSYLTDEIRFIKDNRLLKKERYLTAGRRGRLRRFSAQQRQEMFALFCAYEQELRQLEKIDFSDFALIGAQIITKVPGLKKFTHILIDEAQDLTFAELFALAGCCAGTLAFFYDEGQDIYKRGALTDFLSRLKQQGQTIPKAVVLKRDYRNTLQIAALAQDLADPAALMTFAAEQEPEVPDELTKIDLSRIRRRKGSLPRWIMCTSHAEQTEQLLKELTRLRQDRQKSIGILAAENSEVNFILNELSRAGIKLCTTEAAEAGLPGQVCVSTINKAKGFEFNAVILVSFNELVFKLQVDAEAKRVDKPSLERTLSRIYTALTRAQDELIMLSCGVPSQLGLTLFKPSHYLKQDLRSYPAALKPVC